MAKSVLKGIIRMARNPGDQLVRNKARWAKSAKFLKGKREKKTFDQFLVESEKYCKDIAQEGTWDCIHAA